MPRTTIAASVATTPETATPVGPSPVTSTPADTTRSTAPEPSSSDLFPEAQRSADDLATVAACTLSDIGVDQILVFGNSTDYTFGPDDGIDMVAWPELLRVQDTSDLLTDVAIRNEAQRGQTMGDWDAWGPDPRLRLNTYATTVLDTVAPTLRRATLALVAPSFIDLQESDADIDRAISDLSTILATLDSYGLHRLVLPMNYVSTTLNDRLPGLNPAIEEFNRELLRLGLLAAPLVESPLRSDGPVVGGAERWYDEFPGRTKAGDPSGADGFHPDEDGQLLKADAVTQVLATFVEQAERSAGCA